MAYAGPRGIEIPYRAFPERFGPRILSLESVDYFGTTGHFSGRKKILNEQNFKVYWKIRMHVVYNSKHCILRLYGDVRSRY